MFLMDLYEFIQLPEKDKATTTWYYATYLMSRVFEGLTISLYQLDDFFIEVYCDPELNYIQKISAFKSIECLDPYLDLIDLNRLIYEAGE
jgi:hypothetical protein